MPDKNHKLFKTNISIVFIYAVESKEKESIECLAVGNSGEDVSHSAGSLGEGVGEVLLGEGAFAAVLSDERSKSGSDLAVKLAEVFLIEDKGFIGFLLSFAWEGGVDLGGLVEDLVNPLRCSDDVVVGGGGVVVGKIEEGIGVASELVKSLDGAKRQISKIIAF